MAAQLCAIAVRHDFDRASGTTNYNVKVAEIIGRHVATQHAALLAERDELRREVERLKESANFHRRLGITLLDAKWLDPECHKGCQSLLFKNALTAERTLREANENLVTTMRDELEMVLKGSVISIAGRQRIQRILKLTPDDFLPPAAQQEEKK